MKIAITGSTGLIGSKVASYFEESGHDVVHVIRPSTVAKDLNTLALWDYMDDSIDLRALEGCDAIIHLAGVNIAQQRWNEAFKDLLYDSRIKATCFLAESMAKLKNPPKVFICASAVGYYGNCPSDQEIDESNETPGQDFLAQLCKDWEKSTYKIDSSKTRVIYARFGVVLSKAGGALAKMMPVFKMGMGGAIGNGRQMMSWVALEEIPSICLHLIVQPNIKGAVNIVSPQPVSNKDFSKKLGEILKRPAILPLPSAMAKIMFGEMAEVALLSGQNVRPKKLIDSGYSFSYATLDEGMRVALQE